MLCRNKYLQVMRRTDAFTSFPLVLSRCAYAHKNACMIEQDKTNGMRYYYLLNNTHECKRPASQKASNYSSKEMSGTTQDNYALFSLYRRLRKSGEDRAMIEHSLSVYPLEQSIQYGIKLLRYHRQLTEIDVKSLAARRTQLVTRLKLAILRRYYAFRLFALRLKLHSLNALSDLLTYALFLVVCVLLYEIYHTCRVGVNRAQERYRTLSIPVVQTFMALEAGHERRRKLREELEEDIRRDREK